MKLTKDGVKEWVKGSAKNYVMFYVRMLPVFVIAAIAFLSLLFITEQSSYWATSMIVDAMVVTMLFVVSVEISELRAERKESEDG